MLGNNVKEMVVHLDDIPAVYEQMGLGEFEVEECMHDDPWHYFMFVKCTCGWKLPFVAWSAEKDALDHSFSNFIKECGPIKDFMQLKLAMDLFWRGRVLFNNRSECLDKLISIVQGKYSNWSRHPVLDELLSHSNGVLIWKDQLNSILACSNVIKIAERQALIKELNAKRVDAYEKAETLKVLDTFSLMDVMDERMLHDHCVFEGFWDEALVLYNSIIKK